MCHIIADEADKSPLRWTDGGEDNSIFIHNINNTDKVCNVRVWSRSFKNSPVRAVYYVYFTGKYSSAASEIQEPRIASITDVGGYKFILPGHVIDFVKDVVSRKENTKENNMKEFTLATVLFGKLKEKGIYYKFDNGVYNSRNIVITTKMNYNICRIKSIPDPSDLRSYWVNWFGVPAEILVDLKIDRTTYYDWSDELIEDILKIEKKLISIMGWKPIEMSALAYVKGDEDVSGVADVLETEVIHKYRNYGIVDVIFNDPATIVIWADGSKTVVKANGEKFDPEKGLAMAISKKVLGNKHDYYELFKKHVGRYEKKAKKNEK